MENVVVKSGKVSNVVTGVTAPGTPDWVYKDAPKTTIQAILTGTGALTATVVIDCSNDGVNACATALGTISLSGTDSVSDGFTTDAPWKFIRARTTAISGTGATLVVLKGV